MEYKILVLTIEMLQMELFKRANHAPFKAACLAAIAALGVVKKFY